jgi:ribosomal protein S18 acetylase RimI-like enzyme
MVEVRDAEVRDYAAVNELASALVGLAAERQRAFEAVLAHADHDVIVAEIAGEVVGFAHLLTYQDLSHGALAGELLGLIVAQDMRGQGIGTGLLREVCRRAKARGVSELHINTEPDNEAGRRLYARLGAQVVGLQMEMAL